jgi:hypothetical protein
MNIARRWTFGCLIIVILLFGCIGISLLAADRVCYAGLSQRLPIYPNAEIVYRSHNFLTELGMGNTVITLYSPDDPDTVRSWYGRTTGEFLQDSLNSGDPIIRLQRVIAQTDWSITRAEDGIGSQIILFGTCAN